jgi:hypothetical protein
MKRSFDFGRTVNSNLNRHFTTLQYSEFRNRKTKNWIIQQAANRETGARTRPPRVVDETCAALEMGVQEYRSVRRYLGRCPQASLIVLPLLKITTVNRVRSLYHLAKF